MRFPINIALTAVLANGIAAELIHSAKPQTQPTANDLDVKYHTPQIVKVNQVEFPQQSQDAAIADYQNGQQQVWSQGQEVEDDNLQAFDSTKMPYQHYAYSDPVQRYVSNSPPHEYEPETDDADATNEVPTVIDPYSVGYPNNGYNPTAYSPSAFNPNQYNPGAFHVQTGYQGYLVPGPPGPQPSSKQIAAIDQPSIFGSFFNAFTGLAPREGGSLLSRSFAFLMGLLGVTVFGGAVTTTLCTFTPLCTISFAIPFIRSALPFVSENVRKLEPMMEKPHYDLLLSAVKKFESFNADKEEKITTKSAASTLPEVDSITKNLIENGPDPVDKLVKREVPIVKSDIPSSSTTTTSDK